MVAAAAAEPPRKDVVRQHNNKGVYYGGDWLDIEDCAQGVVYDDKFRIDPARCSGCKVDTDHACPRSRSRPLKGQLMTDVDDATTTTTKLLYDVVIIGAGCIGASIARELSRYELSVLWLEAADDVSQGATKGNSGIVHAGYDDKPGTNRAKFCWKGNQMFSQLDKELRFGYQTNGSLVVGFSDADKQHLLELKKRGETNGVQRLRIVDQEELRQMEPHINEKATCALYSPDAGNVIPYEYTIALAENAVDNGVDLRIRRKVIGIDDAAADDNGVFSIKTQYWETKEYLADVATKGKAQLLSVGLQVIAILIFAHYGAGRVGLRRTDVEESPQDDEMIHMVSIAVLWILSKLVHRMAHGYGSGNITIEELVQKAGRAVGNVRGFGKLNSVQVDDMLVGGSGSLNIVNGTIIAKEEYKARYVINCAGGASDYIAQLYEGENSKNAFTVKPRVGDYLLLNRNQGHLAKHTLFPCPDPILGKGVLVQTTLWGNLILGPTARDMYKPEMRDMSAASVQEYILSKCKRLVPSFDPKETIHAFCGARAKSTRGDWIIEASTKSKQFVHVAAIDSPGLAGAPAIAKHVVTDLLGKRAGLKLTPDPTFNPNRAPIILPKQGMKGLKMGPVGKYDSNGTPDEIAKMAANVICKCEKVTELEVVQAMQRSLPIDSSQAIRKRTRAGMGHCQADPDNYNCEARVRAIIARENKTAIAQVGARPWPATSTLSERWIKESEKEELQARMDKT